MFDPRRPLPNIEIDRPIGLTTNSFITAGPSRLSTLRLTRRSPLSVCSAAQYSLAPKNVLVRRCVFENQHNSSTTFLSSTQEASRDHRSRADTGPLRAQIGSRRFDV